MCAACAHDLSEFLLLLLVQHIVPISLDSLLDSTHSIEILFWKKFHVRIELNSIMVITQLAQVFMALFRASSGYSSSIFEKCSSEHVLIVQTSKYLPMYFTGKVVIK